MPNKTVYENTIKEIEKYVGFSFINREEVAQKLKNAWKNDKSTGKVDSYLGVYREIFREVLAQWSDKEISIAFNAHSEKMPDLRKCLLKTDEALKTCAMALIPELRENEDVLSHMTFGVIDSNKLKDEFISSRQKYLLKETSEKAMKKRKAEAYEKYKDEWIKTPTRNIVELVRDKDALKLMSQEEKIDYALALQAYRNAEDLPRPLGSQEKELIDDSLQAWKQELRCSTTGTLEEFVTGQYFQYAQKIGNNEWIENQVNEAISEYNKNPNPAKEEISRYKKVEIGISEDVAEMVGDFFAQEELKQEINKTKESPNHRERLFLQEKVEKFNQEYSLNMNYNKLRTSIEQLSAQMIEAREEKQRFLDKNSVVVIENGKETCYDAKEYYKDKVDQANKTCVEELNRIEQERQRAEKEYKELLNRIEKREDLLDKDEIDRLKAVNEKSFKEKNANFDKAMAKAKADLAESLSIVKGGIVIEKQGNKEKQYKSSRYYETHETKKEQYAYGEYQQMFSRVYKDACKNVKSRNYAEGKIADFSHIAKDIDQLFKSAMYLSNVYDNDKNLEIIQKCSFGGLSAESLASFATHIDGDEWGKEQHYDSLWHKQSDKARKILADWEKEAKNNKNFKTGDMIKETLETRLKSFNKGEITRKQMLDYMIAGEVQMRMSYPSNFSKFANFIQYNRARNVMLKCRAVFGLTEGASLRSAMNEEYTKLAGSMSKEQIFKAVEKRMDYALDFKSEKLSFEKEHKTVQDRELARKESELEKLKSMDKVPMSILALDERNTILNQQPRVQPIVPVEQKQPTLSTNK